MFTYNADTEAADWEEIQEIRDTFNPRMLDNVQVYSRGEALERGTDIVQKVLTSFKNSGYNFSKMEAGHGVGHLTRDYVNSRILFSKLDADPRHAFIGFVGGSLHDLGCAIVPRFDESKRAVRHAEAGALFIGHLLNKENSLNDEEWHSIEYAIAAHTHYRGEESVKCQDGEVRVRTPYIDLDQDGKPIWPVWFTRWIDRLDCNGPTFVGRHYLTLSEKHEDFDGSVHFDVDFKQHMTPSLRPFKEQVDSNGKRNQTMSEHLKMFADSQNNNSPYGAHDYGYMVTLRDEATNRLGEILKSIKEHSFFSLSKESNIRYAWKSFLSANIEPSEVGRRTAETIDEMFEELDARTRHTWCNTFLTTMDTYIEYSLDKIESFIETGTDKHSLPGITDNVIKTLSAGDKQWFGLI